MKCHKIPRCATTLVAIALVIPLSTATAQRPVEWSASAGFDLVDTPRGNGGGQSFDLRRALGRVARNRVALQAGFMTGSVDYSPFSCELARQIYCFGGSESLRGVSLETVIEGNAIGEFLGIDVSPLASIGGNWSRSRLHELEGPTTMCYDGSTIVSCPDNPPFQDMSRTTTRTLPAIGFGISADRRLKRANLRVDLTVHRGGWLEAAHERVRLGLGVGF